MAGLIDRVQLALDRKQRKIGGVDVHALCAMAEDLCDLGVGGEIDERALDLAGRLQAATPVGNQYPADEVAPLVEDLKVIVAREQDRDRRRAERLAQKNAEAPVTPPAKPTPAQAAKPPVAVDPYAKVKRPELVKIAKELGVAKPSSLSNTGLISAIKEAETRKRHAAAKASGSKTPAPETTTSPASGGGSGYAQMSEPALRDLATQREIAITPKTSHDQLVTLLEADDQETDAQLASATSGGGGDEDDDDEAKDQEPE